MRKGSKSNEVVMIIRFMIISSVNSFVTWPTFVLGEYTISFRTCIYIISSYGNKNKTYTETSIHWLIDINFLDVTYTDLYNDAATNVSSENDMCAFQNHFYSFI